MRFTAAQRTRSARRFHLNSGVFGSAYKDANFVTFDEPVIRRIDATHACHEYKIARACTDAPGAGRRNRTLRREDANAARQGVPV